MAVRIIGKLYTGHVLAESDGTLYKVDVPLKQAERAKTQDETAYFKPGMFELSDPEENEQAAEILEPKTKKSFSVYKTDDDKRLVFGWASVAITVDGETLEDRQHDTIEPEELEEAAYEYVLNFRDTGEEHRPELRQKGKLVESCVFTQEKQKAMGIPEGILPVAWWIGFKIEDDEAWEKVKTGTYRMFSIEGKANREPVEKTRTVAKSFLDIVQSSEIN